MLTNDGINTYQWDARDRLVAISGPALTASFAYDALGRRTSKTINGHTTTFVYDGDDIVAEVGSQTGLVTYLRGLSIDDPFIRQTATGNEYYHVDGLGSTLALSNGSGTSTTAYTYDPFGKTTVSGPSTNAFQYTSRENDETGLYYYRARYYSPTLHRFISEDPIGLERGDENFCAYTFNSPLNFTDPSGTIGLGGCLVGIAVDAALSGRKPTLASVAGSCALGAIGGQAAKHAFTAVKQLYKSLASKLASQAGKRGTQGASGDLTTASGKRFTGNSTKSSETGGDIRAPMHPQTQKALDGVQNQSRTHTHCCEVDAVNKAFNAGESVSGAKMGPVTLNETGKTIGPCSSCREFLRALGVE